MSSGSAYSGSDSEIGKDARSVHTLVSRAVQRSGVERDPSLAGLTARRAAIRSLLELLPGAAADVRSDIEIRRELDHARHLIAAGLHDEEMTNVACG
jgi:hypothetical protein